MKKMPLLVLTMLVAVPVEAEQIARPIGAASADETVPSTSPAPSTSVAETGTANQAALSASAAQTARIVQDREANARNLAAYTQAQADYARSVKGYEAEKAAIARRTADDAEAYRQRLAGWQEEVDRRRQPVRKPPAVAEKPRPRIVCAFEKPTGSNTPVRVCRSEDE